MNYEAIIELDNVTLAECLDLYEKKGIYTEINDGRIINLAKRKGYMENRNYFTTEDKKILLELICDEQIHMIIKDNTTYISDKYRKLEELKAKVNSFKIPIKFLKEKDLL